MSFQDILIQISSFLIYGGDNYHKINEDDSIMCINKLYNEILLKTKDIMNITIFLSNDTIFIYPEQKKFHFRIELFKGYNKLTHTTSIGIVPIWNIETSPYFRSIHKKYYKDIIYHDNINYLFIKKDSTMSFRYCHTYHHFHAKMIDKNTVRIFDWDAIIRLVKKMTYNNITRIDIVTLLHKTKINRDNIHDVMEFM